MRILFIEPFFSTSNGGGDSRSYDFAKFLVRRGHEVTVIARASAPSDARIPAGEKSQPVDLSGIQVIAIDVPPARGTGAWSRGWSALRWIWKSTRTGLAARGHDIVFAASPSVAIPGLLVSGVQHLPLVFEVRDLWPAVPVQLGEYRHPLVIAALRGLEKLTYRRSTAVIALSPGIGAGIAATGIPESQVTVIPQGSNSDLFVPEPPDPHVVARFGLQDYCVVTHAGSMSDQSGLETLVDAAEILQRAGREDIKIVLVGEGPAAKPLHARIESKRLRNVVFTGGVSRADVAEILKSSDVYLCLSKNLPVLSTCSPHELFDALAAGRPVIVNTDGWMRELIESNQVGAFATPDSAADLAARILDLVGSYEKRHAMGVRARRLAESRFDRQQLAAQFERVLASAAGIEVAPYEPAAISPQVASKPIASSRQVPAAIAK